MNQNKSHIWFSPQTPSNMRDLALSLTGFHQKPSPGMYLGFPLGLSKRKIDFHFITEKIRTHIANWKAKLLSPSGKTTLIKSVVMGILNYYIQCLIIPKSVCNILDKHFCDFFWGLTNDSRKLILIKWNIVCLPKNNGGLGVYKTHHRKFALCSKLAWRMLSNPSSIWAKICLHQNSLSNANTSNVGRAINAGLSLLRVFETKIIHSGRTTSF